MRGVVRLAMAWGDTAARWVEGFLDAHPGLDVWLERHAHAYGLHGPYLRHVLKSLAPAVLVVAVLAVLLVVAVWRSRRAGARQRPRARP